MLELGQEIEVRVEDIDPNGKVSLVPADGDSQNKPKQNHEKDNAKADSENQKESKSEKPKAGGSAPSFEEEFEEGLAADLGDLGPEAIGRNRSNDNRNRRGKGRGN